MNTAIRLVPFSTPGLSGYVPEEALSTFRRKAEAVQRCIEARGTTSESAVLDEAMPVIQRANRTIDARGWHLYSRPQARALVASGRYTFMQND